MSKSFGGGQSSDSGVILMIIGTHCGVLVRRWSSFLCFLLCFFGFFEKEKFESGRVFDGVTELREVVVDGQMV